MGEVFSQASRTKTDTRFVLAIEQQCLGRIDESETFLRNLSIILGTKMPRNAQRFVPIFLRHIGSSKVTFLAEILCTFLSCSRRLDDLPNAFPHFIRLQRYGFSLV